MEKLKENYPDNLILNGLDEAIIGVCARTSVFIYSANRIVAMLEKDMTQEEAWEYYQFNIACLYAGEGTPIILEEVC